jgi:uncharacterized protein YceK
MARKLLVRLFFAVVLPILSGCGTFLNLQDNPPKVMHIKLAKDTHLVYGGVRFDARTGPFCLLCACCGEDPLQTFPLGVYLLAVDLPLSALGDTLTLPITIHSLSDRTSATTPETNGKDPVAP